MMCIIEHPIHVHTFIHICTCTHTHTHTHTHTLTLQASLHVLDEDTAQLWWAGKELQRTKKLSEYVGRNEKTKIIAKLQKKGKGAPAREPIVSEEEQKRMMAYAYRKQEEFKVRIYNILYI